MQIAKFDYIKPNLFHSHDRICSIPVGHLSGIRNYSGASQYAWPFSNVLPYGACSGLYVSCHCTDD